MTTTLSNKKRLAFHPDKYRAIQAEVQQLKEIKFIREVSYPTWVSNVVMVPKPNGKWRMCVDYTNLNSWLQDGQLPIATDLVDSTAGYKMLSFLDAYSGYNQIKMHPANQTHTTFVTDKGLYCYEVMPFGLKNAGATYQRLVNAMFEDEIGEAMEVYVDDMLVKSRTEDDHIANLSKIFTKLLAHGMRLNPQKCILAVGGGKFLGFMMRIWCNYPVAGDHSRQDNTGEPFKGIQRVKVRQQSTCQTHSPGAKHPLNGRCRKGPQTVPHRGLRPQRLTLAYKAGTNSSERCKTRTQEFDLPTRDLGTGADTRIGLYRLKLREKFGP
ncbi:hypothetical protein ACLB2K_026007 [Fragaria x ananassa]